MFAKIVVSRAASVAVKRVVAQPVVRAFGAHAHHEAVDTSKLHFHGYPRTEVVDDVVIPQLSDTLEWMLTSPPNVHTFNEPPIIVEIEHLNNLKYDGENVDSH